ncbi:TPA: hypothetical protein PXJ50_004583 [Yersinia enterocolitica]|uniref:hypothetical protein n=1 Tax=Yersinia enterocolitica TaxID=630 RepID=UPI00292779DA|nr:hypothetical protein [Yersinia enterocolitica]HDL6671082.1 hypothetical protein [Yersinia enterocolitica]HDL6727064.1 hypothetical protein [Yersinia enterocolitica]HDL8146325.1 hypothetical protein [Yersinia enterocolitica]HEB4795863.1 hypothetical protein [Yersinia enterocolitica]
MMDITKSREEFEAWLKSKMPTTYKLAYETENYCDDEDMVNLAKASVLDMRTAWQASRESIVVDIPEEMTCREALEQGHTSDYANGFTAAIIQCYAVVRTAGIRIKGECEKC